MPSQDLLFPILPRARRRRSPRRHQAGGDPDQPEASTAQDRYREWRQRASRASRVSSGGDQPKVRKMITSRPRSPDRSILSERIISPAFAALWHNARFCAGHAFDPSRPQFAVMASGPPHRWLLKARAPQLEMAEAVARAIRHGGRLLVEAGHRHRQDLRYLVPALESGKRIVISTSAKNLQEQLFYRSSPPSRAFRLHAASGPAQGRSNYLCIE